MAQLANFNPDWDKLEACQESWRELAELQKETLQRAEAAEARLLVPVKLPTEEFNIYSGDFKYRGYIKEAVIRVIRDAGYPVEGGE
ncbi:hypothetical protein [Yersinia canariae]|uniref:hypothetical protein n=1 Tax=Yersinia canariae TaxID=2607663 RepID=UPI00119FEB86|nr:hypothetical protein [Yersinia canariae]